MQHEGEGGRGCESESAREDEGGQGHGRRQLLPGWTGWDSREVDTGMASDGDGTKEMFRLFSRCTHQRWATKRTNVR